MDRDTADKLLRKQHCKNISRIARAYGLDMTESFVNDHYVRCMEWYDGDITTEYLVSVTGAKRKGKDTT